MIWDFGEQEKSVLGHLCLHGCGYHFLSKNGIWPKLPVFGTKIAMIKLSFKSKKNSNINVSSKKTSFWDKDGKKVFRQLPVFGQR